jgi:superfamily I DNA/RNA helicase
VLGAVYGWETLRKGNEVPLSVAKTIYSYLDPGLVAKGFKTLNSAPEDRMYSIKDLHAKWGLLTDGIWHEVLTKISAAQRQYIIALLRRGVKLNAAPKIKLSTIHGAKGGEADNVLLLTDLSTKFAKSYDTNPDDINRLLYVGITRTRKTLHLVMPRSNQKGFRL